MSYDDQANGSILRRLTLRPFAGSGKGSDAADGSTPRPPSRFENSHSPRPAVEHESPTPLDSPTGQWRDSGEDRRETNASATEDAVPPVLVRMMQSAIAHALNGFGTFVGSEALAGEYGRDPSYSSTEERVRALIRWECSKSFGSGFAANVGGLLTLPAAVPAELYAQWVIRARLVGAIACLHGHSLRADRVRTLILLVMLGEASLQPVAGAMVRMGNHAAAQAVKKVPGAALRRINRGMGMRFVTKAGRTGVVNLTRVAPIAGGLVGGTMSCAGCLTAGRLAERVFRRPSRGLGSGPDDDGPIPAGPIPVMQVLAAASEAGKCPVPIMPDVGATEEGFATAGLARPDDRRPRRIGRRWRRRSPAGMEKAEDVQQTVDAAPHWWLAGFLGHSPAEVGAGGVAED